MTQRDDAREGTGARPRATMEDALGHAARAGRPAIPVRRYGRIPEPDRRLFLDADAASPAARTIGERGAIAVLLAGLCAAGMAGFLLYGL